jgi:hypothetical protein
MKKLRIFRSNDKAPVRLLGLVMSVLFMYGVNAHADEIIFSGSGTND